MDSRTRAGSWQLDLAHSEVSFSTRVLGSRVRGRITGYDVTVVTGADLTDSSVHATLDLASVDTGNAKRDEHLRSATFLDVASHPRVTYVSTGVRRADAGWVVDGELTWHGSTRAVPLALAATRSAVGPDGRRRATYSATAVVDRRDFGVDRWTGGRLVGATVAIGLEITTVLDS